jgi:N utilization substance protein A
MKGSRVQNVVQELRGEKIDIIPWHVDAAKFVCNALAPAEISRVVIDESNRSMEVIVPDEFLSVAIGKRGQNVRLASKLTGWHLDVSSQAQYDETMKRGYESLKEIEGVDTAMADLLFDKGYYSAEEVADTEVDDLIQIRGIDAEKAQQLIAEAQKAVEAIRLKAKLAAEEAAKQPAQEEIPTSDATTEGNEPPRNEPAAS